MILQGKTADLLPLLSSLKPRLMRKIRAQLFRDAARFVVRDLRRQRLRGRG